MLICYIGKDLVCFHRQFQQLLVMILITNLNKVLHITIYLTHFTLARKDETGAVVTDPRNFTTKNVKKGKTDDVLFSKPSYVSQGINL
jgi:hypothetical protein